MFYKANTKDHGLPHDPFKAIVSPRPIGWISTINSTGHTNNSTGHTNLAPYSFFNGLHDDPPMVMFSSTGLKDGDVKDSLKNIRDTGEFCVNFVSLALKDMMNITSGSYSYGVDEFAKAGLEKGVSQLISAPYVKKAPAAFECKLFKEVALLNDAVMIIGKVIGIHIDDQHIKDGIFDVTSYQPLARLGYKDYTAVRDVFSLTRP